MLTDDQRWDPIGLAGSNNLKTPSIDRLGQEGVSFRNAFCTTSCVRPAGPAFSVASTRMLTAWSTGRSMPGSSKRCSANCCAS
ncbi:MAG: hypothetical protein AB9869_32145 [Verrucomicrobiia bacterium]